MHGKADALCSIRFVMYIYTNVLFEFVNKLKNQVSLDML